MTSLPEADDLRARRRRVRRRVLVSGAAFLAVLVGAGVVGVLARDDETGVTVAVGGPSATSPIAAPTDTSPTDTEPGAVASETTQASETTLAPTTVATTTTLAVDPSTTCPPADGSATQVRQFRAPPPLCIDTTATYVAVITTSKGVIEATLDPARAPKTVNNFVFLARYKYYDGLPVHRVIKGFILQTGDPAGDGTGGPGYEFEDELPSKGEYRVGSLAMASGGPDAPDTNGSQFFIVTGDAGTQLDPNFSLFGQVSAGQDVLAAIDALGQDGAEAPSEPVAITSITIRQEGGQAAETTAVAAAEPTSTTTA